MIFDERDLEEENIEEDKTPLTSQMSFDDLKVLNKKSANVRKTKILKEESENEKAPETKEKTTKKADKTSKNSEVIRENLEEVETKKIEEKAKKPTKKNEEKEEKIKVKTTKKSSKKVVENLEKNEEFLEENAIKQEENLPEKDDIKITQKDEEIIEKDDEGNILKSIKTVMHEAMMPYSEYVILDRALPRVEDGLKPVQRRILYSMYELGLTPDKPFKKSAKIVGDVIANYHPHGDSSVYNAMVKLAQKFNMRESLVLGHGNFGSVDGDPAAAYRYTEAKLEEISLEILRDIDKDTVKWSYNYDDSKFEPDMLPSRFPNILVNGTMGIAVGIATNFACHNLGESIDACVAYIDNPKITTDELMQVLKGPDFPTGGIILGVDEIKKAYETGKGKITIRAKIDVEHAKNDKINLIITEFPYGVNKAMCLQKISELKENNKDALACITDIRDESDRNGIRAVISLKKDSDPQKLINYLYKYSDLQTTFGINMVAIAEGKPKLLTLKDILGYYTRFQKDVIFKRTTYDLNVAKEREHILQGLIIAIENIDEIVKIIKNSASVVMAKQQLKQRYDLSERQAQAIMDMRLARLTNLEVEKLREEIASLQKLIAKLTKILGSEKLQYNLVKEEMLEIKKKFGNKRRTNILKENGQITEDDIIKVVKPEYVMITQKNAIKKMPEKNFNKTARIISSDSNLNEIHSKILLTQSDKNLLLFTNFGNVYKISMDKVIEARFKDRGMFLKDLIVGFSPDEKVVNFFEENDGLFKKTLIFYTKNGMVKLTTGDEFNFNKQVISAIKLKDDEVIGVDIFDSKKNLMFVTKLGMGLYAKLDDMQPTSKNGIGVKGINLNDGDSVVFAGQIADQNIVVVTNKGYGKKIEIDNFELLPKNRKGLKVYSLGKGESTGDRIIFAGLIKNDVDLFVTDNKNKNYVIDTQNILKSNRTNKGNVIIKDRKLVELNTIFEIKD